MARRRKKSNRRQTAERQRTHGYDYGFLPRTLALGSITFAQNLTQAETIALAFGEVFESTLGHRVPIVSLVARKEEPLRVAFEEFRQWSDASDGDALNLTIVFRGGAEYLLALGPEPHRLKQRCLGFERVYQALPTFLTWVKPQTATGPHVRQFQDYCRRFVSPFIFHGATYTGLVVGATPDSRLLRPLPDSLKILKLSAEFYEEAEAQPGTIAWGLLTLQRTSAGQTKRGFRTSRPKRDDLFLTAHATREEALKYHFPVTVERARCLPSTSSLRSHLKTIGVEEWQIDQAFCNLVLSFELVGVPHFVGLSRSAAEEKIVSTLRTRFELADGRTEVLSSLTESLVLEQVRLDTGFLLRKAGINPGRGTVPELLEELRRLGLLTAPERTHNGGPRVR